MSNRKDRGRKRKVDKEDGGGDGETEEDVTGSDYGKTHAKDPKYATWTPPVGQTGDGRTHLNDKLGY